MKKDPVPPLLWNQIRLFAMDVDGILTDGNVHISSNGVESKSFSVLDGLGINSIQKAGITVAWISGRPSEVTAIRAAELGIAHLVQGRRDKKEALIEVMAAGGFLDKEVCYMGDDIIDIAAMEAAMIGVTVPNALSAVKKKARWITENNGGSGAVREICDFILEARALSLEEILKETKNIRMQSP